MMLAAGSLPSADVDNDCGAGVAVLVWMRRRYPDSSADGDKLLMILERILLQQRGELVVGDGVGVAMGVGGRE